MKAMVYTKYGSPEVLQLREVEKPVPQDSGVYVETGGAPAQIYQAMFFGPVISLAGGRKMLSLAVKTSGSDLKYMAELLEAGRVKPVIDRSYPLGELAEAVGYYGKGHSRGKVVIIV